MNTTKSNVRFTINFFEHTITGTKASFNNHFFHREIEDTITQKEADFLEDMICLHLREQFDNQPIIQMAVSDWIANGIK